MSLSAIKMPINQSSPISTPPRESPRAPTSEVRALTILKGNKDGQTPVLDPREETAGWATGGSKEQGLKL